MLAHVPSFLGSVQRRRLFYILLNPTLNCTLGKMSTDKNGFSMCVG